MRDEYRDLLVDAKDALSDLLRASGPGTGIPLHQAYNLLKNQLAEADKDAERAELSEERQRQRDEWDARRRAWFDLPWVERERWVMDALGDDRLRLCELTRRLQEQHADVQVWDPDLRAVLNRLAAASEVDRMREPRAPGSRATLSRWSRRRALEGPIADLERSFHEDQGAKGNP